LSKIKSAWITVEAVWAGPIDGLEMMCSTRAGFQELCALFGGAPKPSERFTLHIITCTTDWHLGGMGINHLRIVLDELSQRGLDLSEVGGMEARYEVEK